MILTHPALPGPWSGNCYMCRGAALALLIRYRESCSIFSKWSSVGDDYRKIFLIGPGLLPRATQKDRPSSSLWPDVSCDDSFPIPSHPIPSGLVLSGLYDPASSHAFQMPLPHHRAWGGKLREGAQEMSLGNHMLKNPKLTG